MSAPNVILILADQQRHDTMGVHGCPLELTPHLDRRAGDGLHLARHYTPHPVCTPARAALWTSRYGQLTGVHRNGTRLPTDDERGDGPTVADVFNDHDYRTGYIGKWHLAHGLSDHHGPVPPEARGGFRDWLAADALELLTEPNRCVLFDNDGNKHRLPGYRTDALTDAAIRYVQQRHGDGQPFFLVVSHLEPHEDNLTGRYVGPAGMAERYRGRWMPPDLTTLPGVGAPGGQQLAGLTGGNAGADWADYCAMCRRLDDATQRLTEAVESLDFS
ncbi:MAG: sulfatase-like hydrolase/transferase, partial [Planctomycetota bacterium]